MQYVESPPSREIANWVRCFWSLKQTQVGDRTTVERVLPDGNPEIVFNLADRFRRHSITNDEIQPATIVVGQMTRFVMIEPTGTVELFGVRFHPFGLMPLLGDSMTQMTDRIESLANIAPGHGVEIEERLASAADFHARIRCFERWFLSFAPKMRGAAKIELIRRATRVINEDGGASRIRDVSSRLGVSQKKLERVFCQGIGVTPKTYSRVARLKRVVHAIDLGEDWAETAYRCGYFDQAHFIHEFRAFSGLTPGAFVRETNRLNELFTAENVEFLQ
jgi:methylphosphotriester-DNA--protein-cysteine methyltransferase